MLISKSMTQNIITIGKDENLFTARDLMKQHRIRHLPVVEGEDDLIGILTDRDLRSAMPYSLFQDPDSTKETERLSKLTVNDCMTKNPDTIPSTSTIQDALHYQAQRFEYTADCQQGGLVRVCTHCVVCRIEFGFSHGTGIAEAINIHFVVNGFHPFQIGAGRFENVQVGQKAVVFHAMVYGKKPVRHFRVIRSGIVKQISFIK